MHVILDIDHTLIFSILKEEVKNRNFLKNKVYHEGNDYITIERPYLQPFLDYVFENFDNVSIWTLGNDTYAEWVLSKILNGRKPKYVFHNAHGMMSKKIYGEYKDLRLLRDKLGLDFDLENTILVDDQEYNCKHQPKNCVLVESFLPKPEKYEDDEELVVLWDYLKNIKK